METAKINIDVREDEFDKRKPVMVDISGEDFSFVATPSGLSFSLDEDNADKLHFHIGALLQEREMRKEEK